MNKVTGHYLKVSEACQILGVCRNTMRRLIEDGQVEAVDIRKKGGRYAIYRIKPDTLRDFHNEAERVIMAGILRGLGWE